MRLKKVLCILTVMAFGLVQAAFAHVSEIVRDKLPEPDKTGQMLEFIVSVEPLAKQWLPNWPPDVPKSEVVKSFQDVYADLGDLAAKNPRNPEVWLLKGLTAHYAFNLDMKEYYDKAWEDYQQAAALDPKDFRPRWFAAFHQVQGTHVVEGMNAFMELANTGSAQLPAAFWEDYAYGAQMAFMPAHVRMAKRRFVKAMAAAQRPPEPLWEDLPDTPKLVKVDWDSDPTSLVRTWTKDEVGGNFIISNRAFGLEIKLPQGWSIHSHVCANHQAVLDLRLPGKKGKDGMVNPHIVVMAALPAAGETLEAFMRSRTKVSLQPAELPGAGQPLTAFEASAAGMYKSEGGAHLLMAGFSRPEPEEPGVLLEKPVETPKEDSKKVQYYRPTSVFVREKGVIFYFLMLDSAESVYPEARKDFEALLANLKVE